MQKLFFTVDSALLGELGERLVEKSYVALTELVKNAYDADAPTVTLEFIAHNEDATKIKKIRITDTGSGMNIDKVRKYWMRIATTIKKVENVSPRYGRLRTGSKGIGRFACRRLGKLLKLETTAKTSDKTYKKISIEFSWKKFKEGSSVTKIPVEAIIEDDYGKQMGTALEISNISSRWTQRDFDTLRRHLVTLAANVGTKRKGYEEDPGFNVILQAPGFEGGIGNIRDQIITSGWATLTGKVNARGDTTYKLMAKKIGSKSFNRKRFATHIPNVSFRIGILPLVKTHMRNIKVASLEKFATIIQEWGGIYIRYNGFRVYPYGELGDDWLAIDRDRGRRLGKPKDEKVFNLASQVKGVDPSRFLLNTLSNNQYFGHVEIFSNKTKGLQIKANREGFVDSEELRELKKFVRAGIDWATIYYNHYLFKISEDKAKAAIADFLPKDALNKISTKQKEQKAINVLENSIKLVIDNVPEKIQNEIEEPLRKATKLIKTISGLNQAELAQTRLIASANPILFAFSHEVRVLVGMLYTHSNQLRKISKKIPIKYRDEFMLFTEDLKDTEKRFSNLLTMIGLLVSKEPEKPPEKLALKPRIVKAIECMRLIIDYFEIKIDDKNVPDNVMVGPILEPELFSVLVNILSNSIKAVIASDNERKIKFEVKQNNGFVKIRVLDTGIGLSRKYWEEVFTPLIADPEGKLYSRLSMDLNEEDFSILGKGSGIGLNIIRQIMRERGGDVYFTSPPRPWSTCVEVSF